MLDFSVVRLVNVLLFIFENNLPETIHKKLKENKYVQRKNAE